MNKNVTTITAHSGCEGTPDDSLESIKKAISLGADIAELDVRFDEQKRLVISHNRKEDYSGCFPLQMAMEMVLKSPGFAINCDIKESETIPAVLALADELGMGPDKLCFSESLSPRILRENPKIVKRSRVYFNIEEILLELYMDKQPPAEQEALRKSEPWKVVRERMEDISVYAGQIASLCGELKVYALNFPIYLSRAPIFTALRELNTPFAIWTVNEPAEIQRLLGEKVCNITTRKVEMAIALRNKK